MKESTGDKAFRIIVTSILGVITIALFGSVFVWMMLAIWQQIMSIVNSCAC